MEKANEAVLVGIDPGIVTGYAIIDLKGRVLDYGSKYNFGLNALIKKITAFGKVLIIAVDTVKVPKLALKIAQNLRAILIKPPAVISQSKKKKIVRSFLKRNKIRKVNKHEADAFFAVLLAFKHIRPLLEKIKHEKIKKATEVLVVLLRHEASNIKQALKKVAKQLT